MTWLLILLTYKLIKTISFLFVCLLITINYESKKIINTKFIFIKSLNRYANYCIKPLVLNELPDKIPVGTLLYSWYWNKVFDVTYIRIENKNKLLKYIYLYIKTFGIKNIIKRVLLAYFEISLLFIKIVINIIAAKNSSVEDRLFELCANPYDERVIVNMHNEWITNSNQKNCVLACTQIFIKSKNGYVTTYMENNAKVFFSKEYLRLIHEPVKATFCNALFVNKITKIQHRTYLDVLKNEKEFGFRTDYTKAIKNNNYGAEVGINKFNAHKESTILILPSSEFEQIGNVKKTIFLAETIGAYQHGYNKSSLTKKVITSIENLRDCEDYFYVMVEKELGIDDHFIKKQLWNNMLKYSEKDSLLQIPLNDNNPDI